jgi:hypothetical protein
MRSALAWLFTEVARLTVGLLARLEAKPGKEQDVEAFLNHGLQLAQQECTTPVWFAIRLGPRTFGVFDAFRDDPAASLISTVRSRRH